MTEVAPPHAGWRRPAGLSSLPGLGKLHRLPDARDILRRRQFEPLRAAFHDRLWREAAAAVGATHSHHSQGLHRIARGRLVTFTRGSDLMLDNAITLTLVTDKQECYRVFAARGLPVPPHRAFDKSDLTSAETFLRESAGPVVVKPNLGTGGGRGVTTGITTRAALRKAIRRAARFGPDLLIEAQIPGASFRLYYLDGRLIDAVRRDPPELTGDGRRSIRQLVAAENHNRLTSTPPTALSPLVVDADMRNWLTRSGLGPSSVPSAGARIIVKAVVNENASPQNHSVRAEVHPDIVDRLGRLVTDMGVRAAGVDLIAPDIARPLDAGDIFVSEINANPGLHHHVLVADPANAVPVARLALDHIFETRTGVMLL
ncbi:cyanophycin synthetase [Maritimibacter fusiformis]|uniref:Cyanophycin synthetase n=1 Tax=Maritimibacter fusiformis TaxID=2603819 RepID=A0A5D0RN95_9RHOB|nr:cyanophycin synthetase [Maritimibacter fusiformis]TYB82426.1 cyanophycin synthetase [Maritimibacter fusiformis]